MLSNAYKFTPNNGYVSVELRQTDGMLYVTVTNTGPDFRAKELGRVFELFYQASNSSETTGSGIGLHLVKHLVELHHGEVRLDSVPGKDTTVEVVLPCRAEKYTSEEITVRIKKLPGRRDSGRNPSRGAFPYGPEPDDPHRRGQC